LLRKIYRAYYDNFIPTAHPKTTGMDTTSHDGTQRSARGVYGISVASELSGIGPQTLRLYERWGLLTPSRSQGGIRRYSDDDLHRVKRISELVDQGINLAGVAQILELEDINSELEADTRVRSEGRTRG
jgi:MerR family transcriptional regulator, heat shock protein HspR